MSTENGGNFIKEFEHSEASKCFLEIFKKLSSGVKNGGEEMEVS